MERKKNQFLMLLELPGRGFHRSEEHLGQNWFKLIWFGKCSKSCKFIKLHIPLNLVWKINDVLNSAVSIKKHSSITSGHLGRIGSEWSKASMSAMTWFHKSKAQRHIVVYMSSNLSYWLINFSWAVHWKNFTDHKWSGKRILLRFVLRHRNFCAGIEDP